MAAASVVCGNRFCADDVATRVCGVGGGLTVAVPRQSAARG